MIVQIPFACIYTIADPETQMVVYVGYTENFEQRKYAHCHCNSVVGLWIKELCECGMSPIFRIIDTEFNDASGMSEEDWISHYLNEGCELLNINLPGIGRRKYIKTTI